MAVDPVIIGGGIAAAGSILGGKAAGGGGDGPSAEMIRDATRSIEAAHTAGQEQFEELFGEALGSLAAGETEASDEILAGLGMSIEARTKFFDIAKDNLDWVVEFGKGQQAGFEGATAQSKQFLDHYSDLIFNPDKIYDTEVYKSIKGRAIQEWGNFYSGKGLLGGNAQEAMVDRMSQLAYGFLGGERDAALRGSSAANQLANTYLGGLRTGAGASGQIANAAIQTGAGIAGDIGAASANLANITQAFNPGQMQANAAQYLSGMTVDAGIATADVQLAGALGAQTTRSNTANALIAGGAQLGSAYYGSQTPATTTSTFGAPYNPYDPNQPTLNPDVTFRR